MSPPRCFLLLLLLHALFVVSHGQHSDSQGTGEKDYTGHKLIRVMPQGADHIQLLQRLRKEDRDGVNFWVDPGVSRETVDIHLSPSQHDSIKQLLIDSGVDFNTVTHDLQSMIDEERQNSRHQRSVSEEPGSTFNHSFYHTYEEIYAWLDSINEECGSQCEVFSIGTSSEGKDIKVLRLGSADENKPAIWVDAGIHAREWISTATVLHIISKMLDRGRVSQFFTRRITWYFLPLSNPDGYAYTWTHDRMWRKTRSVHPSSPCRGADPNRNWEFYWGGPGTSQHPCSENFRGTAPFSEPETRAMSSFLRQIQSNMSVYISLHSYGQFWLTPWGYTRTLPDDYASMARMGREAARAIRMVNGSNYAVGASSHLLYLAAGGSDDWVKGILGVPFAYTVELRDTGRHGFILPASHIQPTGQEMYQGLSAVALQVLRMGRTRIPSRTNHLIWTPDTRASARQQGYQ